LTSPDSRSDGSPSRGAKLDADSSTPLTRRQLREQRAALEAAEAAAEATAAAEAAAAEAAEAAAIAAAAEAAVPTVTTEIVIVKPAEPAPLTRRQLREREQLERERQLELQAEELAVIEIAEIGSGEFEPPVELVLEPVEPEPEVATLTATEIPLHLARPRREARESELPHGRFTPRARSLAVGYSTSDSRTVTPAIAGPAASVTATIDPVGSRPTAHKNVRRRAPRRGLAKAGLTAVAMLFVIGMTAVTAIPSTVSASPVDFNVVNLSLNANANPESQQLVTAGASSTEVVNRDGYGVTDAGELQAAGYSTAQLLVGRSLAQELVNAMDSGKLVGSVPDHMKEIRWIAQGVTVADCGVDYRVLEIIAIAVRNFDQVGVSDINRKCTGQIEGAGSASSHYIDGGGHAVDFYLLNNKSLDGTDPGTLKLISLLDPVMPVGSHVGQAECRAAAGISLTFTNWTEFDDSCTHMHVDVPVKDAPLLLTDDSLLAAQ
jgi:hypothetical protein